MNAPEYEKTERREGIIFDIKRFAIHDGPGIRTTVFLKGCPLNCWWCHNPESQSFKIQIVQSPKKETSFYSNRQETIGRNISSHELIRIILKDELYYEESDGGVTVSGGEPLSQFDFLFNFLSLLKKEKIHSALDTSGYCDSIKIVSLTHLVDIFLYDIKIIDEDLHKKYTGVSNEIILENLRLLSEKRSELYIRIPIIPSINDGKKEISDIIKFLGTINGISQVDLLPYHNIGKDKYTKLGLPYLVEGIVKPSDEFMNKLRVKFEDFGYNVNIGG